jgi:LPS-assembly lipoprotein
MSARGLVQSLALAVMLASVTGCGFQPVYGPQAASTSVGLGGIDVPVLSGRDGQLLRQALQERLGQVADAGSVRYDLVISYGVSNEGIATQRDTSTTRNRMSGRATWYLVTQDAQRRTVASGFARAGDGYNPINIQYFANQLEEEVVRRRIAEQVADQLVQQLALARPAKAGG